MELIDAWNFIYNYLKSYDIDEPSDVDIIFCEILNKNRAELKLIKRISEIDFNKAMNIARKRATHKPLQRIFGKTNFYGLDFSLNEDTLIPRFDTEILVDEVLKFIKNSRLDAPKILDMCTGSGCIGISVAKNSNALVTLLDINENALNMAKENAKSNYVNVDFIQSNMFENLSGNFDIIIANPPYIKSKDILALSPTVKDYEPYLALNGGEDGLDFYRIIADNSKNFLANDGTLFLEIGFNQAQSVANLLKICYSNIEIIKDLQNNDRVVIARN